MTLAYFGLTSPELPRAILVPPILLPAQQQRHLLVSIPWHHLASTTSLHQSPSERAWLLLPSTLLQPFSQSQHCPGPRPSAMWGAGTALLGPTHTAHGVAQRRGWGATSTKTLHGPCAPALHLSPHSFCRRTHSRGGNRTRTGTLLYPAQHAKPHQCYTHYLHTQGRAQMYRKDQKTNVAQCFLLNIEMGFIPHKWDIHFILWVMKGNSASRTPFMSSQADILNERD